MKKAYIAALSIFFGTIILSIPFVSNQNKLQTEAVVNDTLKPLATNIVIDAGHGGEDSGALSNSGLTEKEVNLDICLTLDKILKFSGFNTQMIRTDDRSIHKDDAKTTRERKVSDLHNRVDQANSNPDNILVSVHQNHFSDSKYYGAQMFYSCNHFQSKNLADCIRSSVTGLLQRNNTRETKKASGIFLLDNVTIPAVIVECGFLSNPDESELLATSEYRDDMAYSIYLGILEYNYLYEQDV